jgi:hypothetical protein
MGEFISYVFVALAGGAVGIAELIARYRDAPFRAIFEPYSFLYQAINALAAVSAFWLITTYGWTFGIDATNPARLHLSQWLVAAFGSMALFRSSFFNFRLGDNDVGIGPSAVLQVVLKAADREVDRLRAEKRSEAVQKAMAGVYRYDQIRTSLATHCMALMQNVSAEEEKSIFQVEMAIGDLQIEERIKILNLGLVLLNIVGADVLEIAVKNILASQDDQGRVKQ